MLKKAGLLIIIVLLILFSANIVWAGFGISPPYVINHNLTRGSHFEKKIWLSRGDPVEGLRIEVAIDVPGANDWITIDKGNSFIMPKGEQKTPMMVLVDVPKNAEFGSYPGYIRLTTYPLGSSEERRGQIAIILGARIDVNLDVKDIKIFDFKVRRINTYDLEEGHKVLWWFSPGKIRFEMEIENLGNVKAAPTKVQFDIYDDQEKNLLETVEVKKMEKVEPFEKKIIVAKLHTELAPGGYTAIFKIFKGDEIVREGKIHLTILPRGTLKPIPKEWYGLQVWIWIVAIIAVVILAIGGFLGYKFYKKKRKF